MLGGGQNFHYFKPEALIRDICFIIPNQADQPSSITDTVLSDLLSGK
jgi:hypothetical protein